MKLEPGASIKSSIRERLQSAWRETAKYVVRQTETLDLVDALLIAGTIMLSEPYPEGLMSLLLGVVQLALMGVFISSPLGVPLVVGLAFLMRRRLQGRDANAPQVF